MKSLPSSWPQSSPRRNVRVQQWRPALVTGSSGLCHQPHRWQRPAEAGPSHLMDFHLSNPSAARTEIAARPPGCIELLDRCDPLRCQRLYLGRIHTLPGKGLVGSVGIEESLHIEGHPEVTGSCYRCYSEIRDGSALDGSWSRTDAQGMCSIATNICGNWDWSLCKHCVATLTVLARSKRPSREVKSSWNGILEIFVRMNHQQNTNN